MSVEEIDYSDLDVAELSKKIGLKAKHIPVLLNSFIQESSLILQQLTQAIQDKDLQAIRLHTHSLKGSAGNLQLVALSEIAKEMEMAAAANETQFDYEGHCNVLQKGVQSIKIKQV